MLPDLTGSILESPQMIGTQISSQTEISMLLGAVPTDFEDTSSANTTQTLKGGNDARY